MWANSVKVLASKVEDNAELNQNLIFCKRVENIHPQPKHLIVHG